MLRKWVRLFGAWCCGILPAKVFWAGKPFEDHKPDGVIEISVVPYNGSVWVNGRVYPLAEVDGCRVGDRYISWGK